jgi:hypothetical protein
MEAKVMKTFNSISSKKTVKQIIKHGKSVKGLRHWVLSHIIMVLMALLMLIIVAPLNASPRPDKSRNSTCHHKIITYKVPVIIIKKSNPVMKKHLKQAKPRKYSFPV